MLHIKPFRQASTVAAHIVASSLLALFVLSVICLLYYNVPVHITDGKFGDYRWETGKFTSRMTEGIAWTHTDDAGYVNESIISAPDVLMLGSSHMEGFNVGFDESVTHQLGSLLQNSNLAWGGEVYNRGISGHHLIKVAKYLEANLADKTPRYVVIETGAVSFTHEDIDSLFNGTVEFSSSHDTGLLYFMQKIPYLRLLASQISGGLLDLFLGSSVQATITSSSEAPKADQTDYDRLIQFIAAACIKYGAEPIIFYHPTATLLENGEIEFDIDREALGLFSTSCQKNGITFINMEEAFLDMWNEDHAVPHGFVTGSSHTGHLNRFGHSKIAEQLASTIITLEEDK